MRAGWSGFTKTVAVDGGQMKGEAHAEPWCFSGAGSPRPVGWGALSPTRWKRLEDKPLHQWMAPVFSQGVAAQARRARKHAAYGAHDGAAYA